MSGSIRSTEGHLFQVHMLMFMDSVIRGDRYDNLAIGLFQTSHGRIASSIFS